MFSHITYLRWQGLSGPIPDGCGGDIRVQRYDAEPATVLLLTAGHAFAVSDTFTARGGEESFSTRRYENFMFGSETISKDLHKFRVCKFVHHHIFK
jgi:hypothetical protein